MDPSSTWTGVLIFIGLLVLSAFFSGSETAFFSLTKAQLRTLRERTDNTARRVSRLMDRPRELLIAILVGNTVVNTAAASVAAVMAANFAKTVHLDPFLTLILQIVIVTFVLIVVVEISPKVFALRHNIGWASNVSGLVRAFMVLIWPITRLFVLFSESMAKVLGVESSRVLFSEEELRTLAEVSEDHGVLEEDEREMIHSIFEFGETEVHEIMIPRLDMVTLSIGASIHETSYLIKDKGHSRIPVYDGDIDHVVGILYAKDLIGRDLNGDFDIREIIREPYFVPEVKRISALLKEFQKEKIHMAIVVDEYGGTEGLVTMEDIIEEIVGDIHDEYDTEEELFTKLEDGEIRVLAKMEVSDFNRTIDESLVPEDEDFESLGGFILSLAGEVPHQGQRFEYQGWWFTVTRVEGNRVVMLRVKPPQAPERKGSEKPSDELSKGNN